jgi:serine/threonine protein kinase
MQSGGTACSICKSPGVNKLTCPCNKESKNPNFEKHPYSVKVCPEVKGKEKEIKKVKKSNKPKIIGKGTYGCVYRPPLQCDPPCTKPKCTKGVSKLLRNKDAIVELASFNYTHNLDPLYIITDPPILCKPGNNLKAKGCKAKQIKKANYENLSLLIYDDLGMDIDKYLYEHYTQDELKRFLTNFANIFYGLVDMWRNGVIHDDIHPKNIVIDKDFNVKLIDYGLMWHKDDPVFPSQFSGEYYYWAPDRKRLDEETSKSEREAIMSKLDTYSLGITLEEILPAIEEDLTKSQYKEIVDLSKNMTKRDYRERYGPAEAFRDWNKIISKL